MLDPHTPFRNASDELGFSILEFWQWNQSQLLSNNLRGVLAEFLVMKALGIKSNGREEWAPYDLITEAGIRIEVKSSAYLQNWEQTKHSKILFGIAPARPWDYAIDKRGSESLRNSDVYVFCVFHEKERDNAQIMDISQWTFYLLPTRVLDEKLGSQKMMSLGTLLRLGAEVCQFNGLKSYFDSLTIDFCIINST